MITLEQAIERYPLVSTATLETMIEFVNTGRPMGGFSTAALSNDLLEAFGRADEQNRRAMFSVCEFIYSEVPMACRGSREAVISWTSNGGLVGLGEVPV